MSLWKLFLKRRIIGGTSDLMCHLNRHHGHFLTRNFNTSRVLFRVCSLIFFLSIFEECNLLKIYMSIAYVPCGCTSEFLQYPCDGYFDKFLILPGHFRIRATIYFKVEPSIVLGRLIHWELSRRNPHLDMCISYNSRS